MTMTKPNYFTNTKETIVSTKKNFSMSKVIAWFVGIILVVAILGYVLMQAVGFVSTVSSNWQEIQFAYNKPAIVKTVRMQYQNKEVALDKQFVTNKPDEQTVVLKKIQSALSGTSK